MAENSTFWFKIKHAMKVYKLHDVARRGRFLTFRPAADDCPLKSPIAIPFGSVSDPSGYTFTARFSGGELKELIAAPNGSGRRSEEVQILPGYKWFGRVWLRGGFGEIAFEVWEVISDADREKAMQTITRSHYLKAPDSGLILGCRFAEGSDQKKVLRAREGNAKLDPLSEAWQEDSGGMIACVVLDTLCHGNPKGRKQIADEEHAVDLVKGKWHKKDRAEIISRLKLLWVSRLAIDAPYRGLGLGGLLARQSLIVGAKHRVPKAKYIEVMTTLPTERAKSLVKGEGGEHDFLVEAGYTRVPELLRSGRISLPDPKTGKRKEPVAAKKLYYYAKAK